MKSKLLVAAAILAALIGLRLITPVWTGGYDARFYRAMSLRFLSAAPAARTAPYCWRLLPATLISLIPFPTETIWHVFNWAAAFFSAFLLFDLLLGESDSFIAAAAGTFFYLFSWVNVRFIFFYPFQSDSTYYLILILAFWSLVRKKDWIYFLALCLGALTREYFLALIPVYYFSRKTRPGLWDGDSLRRTALLAALPLVIFSLIRLLIIPTNPNFSYFTHVAEFGRMFFRHWRRTLYSFPNIYGAALFVILLHLPSCLRYLKKRPGIVVYIPFWFLFLVIGGSDLDRINFIGFPVILLLTGGAITVNPGFYRNKLVLASLVGSHLLLMRVFSLIGPENWRRIWWSSVSFMPEDVFRSGLRLFLLLFSAFLVLIAGVRLQMVRAGKR